MQAELEIYRVSDRPQDWNRNQSVTFLYSRYLDLHYNTSFDSFSLVELHNLIRVHWFDKSYMYLKNSTQISLPLNTTDDAPLPSDDGWGEVEGWDSALGPNQMPYTFSDFLRNNSCTPQQVNSLLEQA